MKTQTYFDMCRLAAGNHIQCCLRLSTHAGPGSGVQCRGAQHLVQSVKVSSARNLLMHRLPAGSRALTGRGL